MNDLEYKEVYGSESLGNYGGFGIKILIASPRLSDIPRDVSYVISKAADKIAGEIQAAVIAVDEQTKKAAAQEREELISVFNSANIFVEEIPNGYCHSWCCRHKPWFIVTTKVGRFTIGWRKRVIYINWEDTIGSKVGGELFSNEHTTYGDKYIHAWSLGKAKEYVNAIITTCQTR